MIKSFNFYIIVMSLSLSIPMLGMEPEQTLLKTILVREAHKTESERKELIRQAFIARLYDRYKTEVKESLKLQETQDLSKEAKAYLEIKLQTESQQLFHKLGAQACIMRSLIGADNFNQIVSRFNITAAQHLVHALNCADISEAESNFYALLHSRNATCARIEATNEIIAKYYSFPVKENTEDENAGNNENDNINE